MMAMIPQNDEFEEDKLGEELPEDPGTPFNLPDSSNSVPSHHPSTDTNLDSTEVYNEGLPSANDIDTPYKSSNALDTDLDKDEDI